MTKNKSFCFPIKKKSDIEQILGSSPALPQGELHVLIGSDYAQKLSNLTDDSTDDSANDFTVDSTVGIILVAKGNKGHEIPDCFVGCLNRTKIVFNNTQTKPLMINNGMLEKEKKEFRYNRFYSSYELEIHEGL